jgi:hypothetical protein
MTTAGQRRQALMSTDWHAGADLLDYQPNLERGYHEAFDDWRIADPDERAVPNDARRALIRRPLMALTSAAVAFDPSDP